MSSMRPHVTFETVYPYSTEVRHQEGYMAQTIPTMRISAYAKETYSEHTAKQAFTVSGYGLSWAPETIWLAIGIKHG